MIRLGVNVDHIATVRQARRVQVPDPVAAALLAELAGADQITVHLREDRRHIQERDVRLLRQVVQTRLNLEMAASEEMLKFALSLAPDSVTLVPERREELTTEGGLEVEANRDRLAPYIMALKDGAIQVSLFIDASLAQVKASHRAGANSIEIHTGRYAEAKEEAQRSAELERITDAAKLASRMGLRVHAGHGLDYQNVGAIVQIAEIEELNIGHSIVARACLVGMERAVREMLTAMGRKV
ncbi:MAG: pyridoxine 5'-phosphate synthase [candidate division NC10 bacterium]|nr:pyridoxine 5'-phosphate synthase [candidate division NC10 bacterium]